MGDRRWRGMRERELEEIARKGKLGGGGLEGLLAAAGPGATCETHTITYPLRLGTTDTCE